MNPIFVFYQNLVALGTVAASIRSRRFEFGVLRSLGLTRFGLVRLIVAEALLIAIVVIFVSIGFGVIAGWCFIGLSKYVGFFGGFTSPLTIPVYWLSLGLGVALVFCFLSAMGPALVASRTSPTRLLQER
jgi:putative ABC transport system permease protein